jgi:hypothetical protein
VKLGDGENDLAVTATDAAENESDAAAVTVFHEPPRAERVDVALARSTVNADDGTLEVVVDVQNNEPEIALNTLGVTLTIPEDPSFAAQPVVVDATGCGHAPDELADVTVALRERLDAHRVVEDFMIAANVAAAKALEAKVAPVVYRIHEPPSREKLVALKQRLERPA